MNRSLCRTTAGLVAILALLLVSACSTTGRTTSNPSASETADDLESLYWERQQDARTRYTEAEVNFMTGMISHHAQALIMSALAPENGAGPQVQTLCSRIINAQNDEIETMQRWLRDRGEPVPEVHISGLELMIHGMEGHDMGGMHSMPGMLTQEQLERLADARGQEFDRLFLTYMIQHHSGAITMVDELFASELSVQDELAFKIASDINVDQRTEIARMELMLEQLSEGSRIP